MDIVTFIAMLGLLITVFVILFMIVIVKGNELDDTLALPAIVVCLGLVLMAIFVCAKHDVYYSEDDGRHAAAMRQG